MKTQDKPNVIFFMVDQMGQKWLEAAMNGICDLPNLKRLQSMGVTFSNAFSKMGYSTLLIRLTRMMGRHFRTLSSGIGRVCGLHRSSSAISRRMTTTTHQSCGLMRNSIFMYYTIATAS